MQQELFSVISIHVASMPLAESGDDENWCVVPD